MNILERTFIKSYESNGYKFTYKLSQKWMFLFKYFIVYNEFISIQKCQPFYLSIL